MKILVTGGAGFIGSYVAKRLLEKGYSAVIVDNFNEYYDPDLKKRRVKDLLGNLNFKLYKTDISDYKELEEIFKKENIDTVCHLAAQAGVRYSLEAPFVYEKSNVLGTLNLLELSKEFKVKKFVFASSSSVYGDSKNKKFSETDNTDNPLSLYAATKKATEALCYSYHSLYNIPMVGLRYFTCFDGDTEVLTPNGIKNIKDILIGEEVYTLNPDTKNMEISEVVATQKFKAPKKMVLFDHSRANLLVTEDHKMFVQTDKGFWRFYDAGTLAKRKCNYNLPRNEPLYRGESPAHISLWSYLDKDHQVIVATDSGKTEENLKKLGFPFLWNRNPNHYLLSKKNIGDPFQFEKNYSNCSVLIREHVRASKAHRFYFKTEAFIRFLGWYLTEGSIRTRKYAQITISQRNKENREEIIKTIKELGFRPTIDRKGVSFSSRLIRNYLKAHNLIGSYNKSIPSHCFKLSYDLRKVLWETMMKGDGDTSGKRYNTASKKMAEDFFHLSLTLGKYALITEENSKSKGIFRVRLRKERASQRLKKENRKIVDYDKDFVYCITTSKNHIIYAGRNKKFGWIGQCFGPYGRPDMALFKFTENILKGKPIEVYGEGKMERDFTYIDDIVDGTVKAIEKKLSFEIFNLGYGNPLPLLKFVRLVEKHIGKKAKKKLLPMQKGDVRKTSADIAKAQKLLNWAPQVSPKEGVKNFVEWYRDYHGK